MTTHNIYTPAEIRKTIESAGVARVSFNAVNSTVEDMLKVYAESFLSSEDYRLIRALPNIRVRHTSGAYFYVFRPMQYEAFLKMISKESSLSGVTMICTTEAEVLYSSHSDASYEPCPTFELKDAITFENIIHTEYSRQFSREKTHLCKLTTRKQSLGLKPVKITEYFLYIPN